CGERFRTCSACSCRSSSCASSRRSRPGCRITSWAPACAEAGWAVKLATWNVNSLAIRLPRLIDWLAANEPAIVGLPATKVEDARFPALEIAATGYEAIFYGQRTYNGVAILSKRKASEVKPDMPEFPDDHKRVLAATLGDLRFVCFYVPNGQSVGSEKYEYKL